MFSTNPTLNKETGDFNLEELEEMRSSEELSGLSCRQEMHCTAIVKLTMQNHP